MVALLASPLASAQEAGRADIDDARTAAQRGEALSPMQRALLGEEDVATLPSLSILDFVANARLAPAPAPDTTPGRVVPPGCATITSPADGATGIEGLLFISFTAPTTGGAQTGYKIFFGSSPGTLANLGTLGATSTGVSISPLDPGTTYFYQIVPTNADGDATGCEVRSITTKFLSMVSTFPYIQDFDASTSDGTVFSRQYGILPDWYNQGGQGDFWRTAASSESQPSFGASVDHTSGTGRLAWVDDSTPQSTDVRWLTPKFDLTGLTAPILKFWYQNVADGNTTVTALSVLNVLVSADGGATYATALTVNTRVNAWTEFVVDLAPYVSTQTVIAFQVMEHPTGFNSDPSLDDVFVGATPTGPIFTLTPGTSIDFGTAGSCSSTASATTNVRVSNQGIGTVSVTSATLTGANASQFMVDTSNLPATLGAGQSATIPVTFQPTFGTTGAQRATLTVTYSDGTTQTVMVTLVAIATDANANGASEAGITFANDTAGACAPSGPQPTTTALIPPTGHVKILAADWDTGTGDDSYEDIDATELAAAGVEFIRAFGRNTSNVWLTSNGNVMLMPTVYNALTDRTLTLPTTYGNGLIAVASMDLNFSSTYNGDTAGELGVPGVYYGSANPNGDAFTDFVVTWWHAYDFGSPSLPNATARYLTAQLIVYGGPENEDSVMEIRYPDGNDANGVPYQQNVTVGGTPPIADDIVVGISNAAGTAAAEYREDAVGGPITDGNGVAIRFTPDTQGIANGMAGWRMMGAPVTGFTVDRLAELNLVQSVVGQYPTFPADNLYTNYDGTAYAAAADVADVLVPGQGFIWYLFDLDLDPTTGPTPATDGDSESYTLPMLLQGTGQEIDLSPVSVPLHMAGDKWNMVANPFRSSLDLTNLASWATGGTLTSGVGQVWNPNVGTTGSQSGSYVTTTSLGNVVTAWQGLFVQNNTATSLDVPASAKTTGGTFVGLTGENVALLGLELSGVTPDGAPTVDVAAVVAFADGATTAWDLLDAGKLTPLADRYATAAFVGQRDGEARLQAQMSLPSATGTPAQYAMPVVIEAVGTTSELTIAWPQMQNVPDTWTLELRDLVTGTVIDLRQATSYAFTVAPSAARTGTPADWAAETTLASEAGARTAPRFELVVSTSTIVAGSQDVPAVFSLERVAPNPTASGSTVRFGMPDAGTVSVAVYDLLGREVATLASGEMAAGWHTASVDASRLSAGVYVIRMQAGTFQATQRMTVVR